MNIRKHIESDREGILELLRLNTPAYFSPDEEKDLIEYLEKDADNYFVVEEDGRIWVCGGFNLSEDGQTAKISWDIVHPEAQGKGVGTELTKFRIRKMKQINGVRIISVRTSQLAYKFYEKFGLQLREVVKDYWAVGFDMYRLENEAGKIDV